MKKTLKYFSVLLISLLFGIGIASATEINDFAGLQSFAATGGEATLTGDITMTDDVRFVANSTIDLNGYTINTARWFTLIAKSELTIKDTSANPGKITTGALDGEYVSGTDYQALQVGGKTGGVLDPGKITILSGNYEGKYIFHVAKGELVINGGTFTATSLYAIGTTDEGNTSVQINGGDISYTGTLQAVELNNASLVMNGGRIHTTTGSGIVGFKDADVTINNGTIEAKNFALSGNGSPSGVNEGTNAKFTVNGGTLNASHGPAIYAPQVNGVTTITGGTLTGVESALEIRAGKLNVSGGTFNGNTERHESDPNGNGTTTVGAGVAIAQHTTKQPIEVNISGGTFNGYTGLSETNPQGNSAEDIAKITINVTGGTFNAVGSEAVISEDFTGFIKGGRYNSNPASYVADGFTAYTYNNEDYEVLPTYNISIESDKFILEEGKTISYIPEIDEAYMNYIRVYTDDNNIATYKDGELTGVKAGQTVLIVELGGLGDSKPIYVYKVKPATASDADEKKANNDAANEAGKLISSYLDGETVDGLSPEVAGKVTSAIIAGNDITALVSIEQLNKDNIPSDTLSKIEEAVSKEGGVIAGYFDIRVLLQSGNTELGNITKLNTPITVAVDLSKEFIDVPSGYDRTYFVVRLHNGETSIIKATYMDGKLYFESDRFSTYTVAYKDTEVVTEENPKTGDSIGLYITMSLISFAGIILSSKKRHA